MKKTDTSALILATVLAVGARQAIPEPDQAAVSADTAEGKTRSATSMRAIPNPPENAKSAQHHKKRYVGSGSVGVAPAARPEPPPPRPRTKNPNAG